MTKALLSLFSGCGGMDLGFEGDFTVHKASIHGSKYTDWINYELNNDWVRLKSTCFKTVFANDINPSAKAAWVPFFIKRGAPIEAFHLESIVDLVKEAERGKTNELPSDIDIITGGFPCQDFSVAGKRRGFDSHRDHMGCYLTPCANPTLENRGMLYIWMKRLIQMVRPKVFIAENVKGLANLKSARETIENDFRDTGSSGYIILSKIFNAYEYGVPQMRQRIIFFGLSKAALRKEALKALTLESIPAEFNPFPIPTHASPKGPHVFNDMQNRLLPYVTVRQIIGDLPEPDDSPDLSHRAYSKAKWYGNHCQGHIEIKMDAPAPTIRAEHHGNIEFRRLDIQHGGQNTDELKRGLLERRLSVRECARLQTFPDEYEFVRPSINGEISALTASESYKLVGNALPPLLAYHIAIRLQNIWGELFKD